MRKLASNKIVINKGVHEVFNFAANLENFAAWFPGVETITPANELDFTKTGKRYKEVFTSLGSKRKVIVEVKECVSPLCLITESEFRPVLPRMEIRFHELSPDKTEVTWSMFSRNQSITWLIFLPLAKLVMHTRSRKGLKRLAEILHRA